MLEPEIVHTNHQIDGFRYELTKYVLNRTKLIFQLNTRETNRSRTNAQNIPILYIGFLLAMVIFPK